MKAALILCCLTLIFGCANINNRVFCESFNAPFTDPYQSTGEAIAGCTFITVPQIVNPDPLELMWINAVTIPVGICCFVVDIPLEVICDTVCYPFDKYWSIKPEKEVKPLAE